MKQYLEIDFGLKFNMEKYRYLKHTADAKFQAFGKTIEEAFSNAALAMLNLMCKSSDVKTKIKRKINVSGNDKESLLYNFLEELLFLLDAKNFILGKINKIKITIKNKKYELEAEVFGDNASLYKFFGEVKAVTYNSMFIKKDKKTKRFIIQVVVDM